MTAKPTSSLPEDGSLPDRGSGDRSKPSFRAGGLSFGTLLHPNLAPSQTLDDVQVLHWAARQVVEDSLARPDLPQELLERLRASLDRQRSQAEELRLRLDDVSYGAARRELAEVGVYLREAVARIDDRLRAKN